MRSSKKKRRVGPSLAERSRACGHFWKCIVLIIILVYAQARSRRADIRKSVLRMHSFRAPISVRVCVSVCANDLAPTFLRSPGASPFVRHTLYGSVIVPMFDRTSQAPTPQHGLAPARPRGAFERRVPVSRLTVPEHSTVRRVKLSRPISDHSEPLEHPDVKDQTLW